MWGVSRINRWGHTPHEAFPTSPLLSPELILGQPGQVARFKLSKISKKSRGQRQHGRRANVTFVV